MGRYGNIDYPTLTKRSFLLGVGLFVLGAVAGAAVNALGLQLPGWEMSLLVDAEFAGVLIALLSPFVFGILLPLTE